MVPSFNRIDPDFTDEYVTIKSAAEFSEYNQQYLRRLLRKGVFKTKKIGQIWLINHRIFVDYLIRANNHIDNRFGPKYRL